MDDVILQDGQRRLKISIAGIDAATGTATAADFRLTIYAFNEQPTVTPLFTADLDLDQAARLYVYLNSVSIVRDRGHTVSGRFVEIHDGVSKEIIEDLLNHPELRDNPDVVRAVLKMNPEISRAVIETELNVLDIECLAYRRGQLDVMRRLLDEPDFFVEHKATLGVPRDEDVWQQFFEVNQWIFGFALHYVIGEGVQPDKLEQVVAGHSIAGVGKRVDALLQTRGVLRSLCYVEIKTHKTKLLHASEYRSDVWRPSNELSGAVAQSQKTVQLAVEKLSTVLRLPLQASHHEEAQFFNYAPRAIVVCGVLNEFVEDVGISVPKFSSFELYRRSIHSPDIVTFDELHDRARAIVEVGIATRSTESTDIDRSDSMQTEVASQCSGLEPR